MTNTEKRIIETATKLADQNGGLDYPEEALSIEDAITILASQAMHDYCDDPIDSSEIYDLITK